MNKKLEKWLELFTDAKSRRSELDSKITRREELYRGVAQPIDYKTGRVSAKRADCKRNMCFELIETQINNAVPQPKVTPRDSDKIDLSLEAEGYLVMENDRICSEEINDKAERGVLKQGTGFYMVGWDETQSTPLSSGELFVKYYPLESVYPQPGIVSLHDAEYIFVIDLVSIKKIKKIYHVEVPDRFEFKGLAPLVTVYYFNDDGRVSRFGWIDNTDIVVFDEEDYQMRKIRVCSECGERMFNDIKCYKCGSTKFTYKNMEREILPYDLVSGDANRGEAPRVEVKKGTEIDFYHINELPFVCRLNISSDGLYGISDIDLLEGNQISMNKILTKMEENILKAGSFVTKPKGVNIPNTDETLKIVTVSDPNQMKAFSVQTVQANMQQDNILQEEFYQMGRDAIGITDSYQGKRDTTAESGKAKQVAAAQAAGRMESKRKMKDAAYADLYRLMFKFLLAYCDERREYSRMAPNGKLEKGSFCRYDFLEKDDKDRIYYNDRFLFSVDDAATLANNRVAMWQEATNNLVSGAFGNPADPQTLMLYWNIMRTLNYPMAKFALDSIAERAQGLPYELEQAIVANPDILKAVQAVVQNPELVTEVTGGASNANNQQ